MSTKTKSVKGKGFAKSKAQPKAKSAKVKAKPQDILIRVDVDVGNMTWLNIGLFDENSWEKYKKLIKNVKRIHMSSGGDHIKITKDDFLDRVEIIKGKERINHYWLVFGTTTWSTHVVTIFEAFWNMRNVDEDENFKELEIDDDGKIHVE